MISRTTGLDWESAYRVGQNQSYWELSRPSPELLDWLGSQPAPHPGAVALDLGCGTGWDLVALAHAGYVALGVDISPSACSQANARLSELGLQGEVSEADVFALPLQDASVDLVTDRGCLHHLGDQDRSRYADSIARVCRGGARLLIRGSRHDSFPFKRVDADTVSTYLERDFVLDSITPFDMPTDSASLEVNIVALTRRARPRTGAGR